MKRLLTLALLASLCACSHAPPAPRVLRVAVAQEPKTLNPLFASNSVDGFVWRLMFEPLIAADSHAQPVPMLAAAVPTLENDGISRDGLTITYHLRPNLKWTDGTALTSRDVRFTWHAIMNPANNVPTRHAYDDVTSIDTPDATTVVVHLRRRFAPFVNEFFSESDQPYGILPEHVLARYHDLNRVAFNEAPTVSDGPFRFARWDHGDRILLAANNAFFFGKPKLDHVDIITVPDENTAANELRTGSVDYFMMPSMTMYPQLLGADGISAVFTSINGYESVTFNMRRAPMSDVRFRKAIDYAVDKKQLVHDLTFDKAVIATADLPNWMWAHDSSLQPTPYDPAKARSLLAQAHIHTPLSLQLVTDRSNLTHLREAVLLQSMLHAVGIDLQIKMYPAGLLYAPQGEHGIINNGDFDLALFPWVGGVDPDNSSEFSCGAAPPNGWNVASYCSQQMDARQTEALTHYDLPTRTASYHDIEAMVARDTPMIVLWWPRQLEAVRDNFHGLAPSPTSEAWNAWQWSF